MKAKGIVQMAEQQDWLEPIADTLQSAISTTFERQGEAGSRVKNFLHGKWFGHPLHATLTGIPLGAWTVAAALDAADAVGNHEELAPGADAAVAIGLCGAVASAIAGLTDWSATRGDARRIGLAHGLLNIGGTALMATSWLLRKNDARSAGRTIGWLGLGVVAASAYLGGSLVFDQKVDLSKEP